MSDLTIFAIHLAASDTSTEELEGIIEFKCLPSGLHNVKEDLMYVLHPVLSISVLSFQLFRA